jgi:hypothetical protein
MTTKDQAIALAIEDLERYQVKRQDFDRFSGTLFFLKEAQAQLPAPDCRLCHYYAGIEGCWNGMGCTDGDQYKPAPTVVLWRTET